MTAAVGGCVLTRERYLSAIEAGTLRYEVTLELDAGSGRGTPLHCWHTDLYERADREWQAVWSQATAIQP